MISYLNIGCTALCDRDVDITLILKQKKNEKREGGKKGRELKS